MTLTRVDTPTKNNPGNHHYTLDGQRVDGVTTLLSQGIPKPALLHWGIKRVAEYAAENLDRLTEWRDQGMSRQALIADLKNAPYAERDDAANRGNEVHSYAEQLVAGAEVTPPDAIRGHVEACARFLDEWEVRPLHVETVVGSRQWRYAGSLDLVADVKSGRTALFDYKTNRSGIFGETALQLAAYRYAEIYLAADGVEAPWDLPADLLTAAVWIRSDGYDVVPVAADADAFKLFCHTAFCARRYRNLKNTVGSPVTPDSDWSAA